MDEQQNETQQRVQGPLGNLHPVTQIALVVVIAAVIFLTGLGLGARMAAAPAPTPTPASMERSAFGAAQVSRELWTAYLNRGTDGWGLCKLADTITCQPIAAAPAALFLRFEAVPLNISAQDWIELSPITVPAGHYVLAGPMRLLGPEVSLARVSPDGTGTLIGPAGQASLNGAVWADLGALDPARYVAVVGAYDLTESARNTTATRTAWGLGFIVSSTH